MLTRSQASRSNFPEESRDSVEARLLAFGVFPFQSKTLNGGARRSRQVDLKQEPWTDRHGVAGADGRWSTGSGPSKHAGLLIYGPPLGSLVDAGARPAALGPLEVFLNPASQRAKARS